jgi:hypothetical protein
MTVRIKKQHPALKHAGYSATSILPGESAAEFKKLHQDLIVEFTPNGALEDETVASMAHFLWRRKNLATFRIAERVQRRMRQICGAMVPMDYAVPQSDDADDFEVFTNKWRTAENKASEEFGELYGLVEMGEEATVDRLMKDLEVLERLDALIDKCLKRLLYLRGFKSLTSGSSSAPLPRLTGPAA